jgi:hypothetical protein
MDKYNKRPSCHDKNNEIKQLGSWISNQQINSKNGRKEIMKENDIYNLWVEFINESKYKSYFNIDNKIEWRNKLEQLKKYIDKYNKRPQKRDINKEIKQLGMWLLHQIHNIKNERKQMMKEEDIYNEWKQFINDNKYKKYF